MKRIDNAAARADTLARNTNDTRSEDELDIDRILADSFPASDPPPWTLGVTTVEDKHDSVRDERGPIHPIGTRSANSI